MNQNILFFSYYQWVITVRYGLIFGKSTVRNYVRYFLGKYGTLLQYSIFVSVLNFFAYLLL